MDIISRFPRQLQLQIHVPQLPTSATLPTLSSNKSTIYPIVLSFRIYKEEIEHKVKVNSVQVLVKLLFSSLKEDFA